MKKILTIFFYGFVYFSTQNYIGFFLAAMSSSRSEVVTQFVHPFVVRSYPYFYFGNFAIFTDILPSRDDKGSVRVLIIIHR